MRAITKNAMKNAPAAFTGGVSLAGPLRITGARARRYFTGGCAI
jgi:hypothetical protein